MTNIKDLTMEQLQELISNYSRNYFIQDTLTRAEMNHYKQLLNEYKERILS